LHVAGSIPRKADSKLAEYAHLLVETVAKVALSNGGGLVVTVGPEPHLDETETPTIFDWTLLEAVDKFKSYPNKRWPSSQGIPVVAVAFEKNKDKIPDIRKDLWKRLLDENKVELQLVPSELSVGGVMRQEQSKYGDILLTLGGDLGVYHLSQLYQTNHKPVIPINLSFNKDQPTSSELLAHHANRKPKDFFEYQPSSNAVTAYSKLSQADEARDEQRFSKNLLDFIDHLPVPMAFYVRVLDPKNVDFLAVEHFFRNVVDKIVLKMGYRRFEMGTDYSEDIFMNLELFENLHRSSLVIVDLTGIRPNCCLELGFALGLGKKFILTAQDGTRLPWDTTSIHCHFWKTNEEDKDRKAELRGFIQKNINKSPIS